MSPEILDLLRRIDNWRRYFRLTHRVVAVPWYVPPHAGEVFEQESQIPVFTKDAMLLEDVWRTLPHAAHKLFIKLEYIDKAPQSVVWRKIRKQGIRISSHTEHVVYVDTALHYFLRMIERAEHG